MSELSVFIQVILVDLLFAGDNAIAIGLVAAGLPKEQRKKVITIGVALAVVARIIFAVLTVQLLKIPGLLFIGGLLLLWVCWRLWSDMRRKERHEANPHTNISATGKTITFRQALFQILVADISMSLDNVLAVAAIARGPSCNIGVWAYAFSRIDGSRSNHNCKSARQIQMDRICRPIDHICRCGNDALGGWQ